MSDNRKLKKAVRDRMAAKGIKYTQALREIEEDRRQAEYAELMAEALEVEHQSVDELLTGAISDALDELVRADFELPDDSSAWDEVELPPGIMGLVTSSFDVDLDTAEVYTAEVFEGGTVAANVLCRATLKLDGLMAKADAYAAAEAGLVTVLDEDWNDHDASVLIESPIDVEVEFEAIANEDTQSVEDFVYVGAMPVSAGRTAS